MKTNILIGIAILAVLYVTCNNFRKAAKDTPETSAITETIPESNGRILKVMGEHPDSANTIQFHEPPPHVDVPWDKVHKPSTSRRAFMTSGWWNPLMAMQPTDTTIYHYFNPKWLKFKEDQTFDILINNKVVDTGNWAFDEDKFIIYLSCKDPYFNNTWAVKERGFRMVWVGNTELNITGIQVRLDNHQSLPATN